MGGFKRSGRFGIVGVFVVAAIVVVIALTTTNGNESNPKLTMGLIFAVIAIFCVVLFALQRADLNRVSGADVKVTTRALSNRSARPVENPTTMPEADLWAAMAVKPIGPEAVDARAAGWQAGRRNQNLGILITGLIFVTVPAIYLTESFLPLVFGGPLIVIVAIYGVVRAVGPGGEMDRGYENLGIAMEPLGLEVTERPRVGVEVRNPVGGELGPKVRGALEMRGERHGRVVHIRLGSEGVRAASEVTVTVAAAPYSMGSRKLTVKSGPEGIVVTRKGGAQGDWLCDLWLAERLAAS